MEPMTWLLFGGLGLLLLYNRGKAVAPVSAVTDPNPSVSPTVNAAGPDSTGYTSPRQAFAAGDLPGSVPPADATTYGRVISPYTNPAGFEGAPTEIPGWLGNAIDKFFGFGALPKVTDLTAGYNATVIPGTERQGPTDPNLDPNYSAEQDYQNRLIAAGALAANEEGAATNIKPTTLYDIDPTTGLVVPVGELPGFEGAQPGL